MLNFKNKESEALFVWEASPLILDACWWLVSGVRERHYVHKPMKLFWLTNGCFLAGVLVQYSLKTDYS